MATSQRVNWHTWRRISAGGFLAFCAFSILAEIGEGMKQADALRRSRNGLAGATGNPSPPMTPGGIFSQEARKGLFSDLPPTFADALAAATAGDVSEPVYQPVMIMSDKLVECTCGARAVWLVVSHSDGAGRVYDFGGFCSSCWAKLDQLGKA